MALIRSIFVLPTLEHKKLIANICPFLLLIADFQVNSGSYSGSIEIFLLTPNTDCFKWTIANKLQKNIISKKIKDVKILIFWKIKYYVEYKLGTNGAGYEPERFFLSPTLPFWLHGVFPDPGEAVCWAQS